MGLTWTELVLYPIASSRFQPNHMFKLSKKADYGLIAVKHLAMHRDRHAYSATEIAEEYGISTMLMAKVLQKLARRAHRIRKTWRQWRLPVSKEPSQITALEVISAIDGPVLITSCVTSHGNCGASRQVLSSRTFAPRQ